MNRWQALHMSDRQLKSLCVQYLEGRGTLTSQQQRALAIRLLKQFEADAERAARRGRLILIEGGRQ